MGLPLREVLGWPNREVNLWAAWLDDQWNQPDRTDHYLIQVAYLVALANSKNPRRLKMGQFKIEFGPEKRKGPATREQAAAWSKAKWLGMMTMPVRQEVAGGAP